jgi:hypothetical protein
VYLSEWSDWKRDPRTKELLKMLADNRIGRLEEIAHGHGLEQIHIEIGRIQGIEDALQFLVADVKDILIDDTEANDGA